MGSPPGASKSTAENATAAIALLDGYAKSPPGLMENARLALPADAAGSGAAAGGAGRPPSASSLVTRAERSSSIRSRRSSGPRSRLSTDRKAFCAARAEAVGVPAP